MKKVLICDDDKGILDITTIVLEEKGYKVVSVNNSDHLLIKVDEIKPDLVLLDLRMSGINGEKLTKKIKGNSKTKSMPVIVVSASRDTEEVAKKIGADGFLSKPFGIAELENIVKKFLV